MLRRAEKGILMRYAPAVLVLVSVLVLAVARQVMSRRI